MSPYKASAEPPATSDPFAGPSIRKPRRFGLYPRGAVEIPPVRDDRLPRALIAFALVVPVVLAAGCEEPKTGGGAAHIVIMASGTANEPQPWLADSDLARLRAAADTDDGEALVVNPQTGVPTRLPLTPRRSSGEIERSDDSRARKIDENLGQVQAQLGTLAGPGGPVDLLEILAAGARATPGPATLIVATDGLSTGGVLDLRELRFGADPSQVARDLKARGALPDLRGWTVVITGLGTVLSPQPALPLQVRTTLANYWTKICEDTGAAACTVNQEPRPIAPPHTTLPSPVVPVPAPTPLPGPSGQAPTSVPADLLFAFDTAVLGPGADSVLRPFAEQARDEHRRVTIVGHSDPRGSEAYNDRLSADRARSVADRLLALGLPSGLLGTVEGVGTTTDPPDASYTDGQLDEAKAALLRRVVITLSPAAPTTG